MKRIIRLLAIVLLLALGFFALNFNSDHPAVSKGRSAFASALATLGVTIAPKASPAAPAPAAPSAKEYATPAGTMAFEELGVTMNAYWKETPKLNDEGFLRLEVRNAETKELVAAPGPLSISVWNRAHSYGIVEPSIEAVKDADGKTEVGIYKASGLFFLAAGQWEVRVYLKKADGTELTQSLAADLGKPAPNPMEDPNSPTYRMMNGMDMGEHAAHHHPVKPTAKPSAQN